MAAKTNHAGFRVEHALELQWIGTLAVPIGSIPVGGQMRARFAMFLEFRGDRIVRQRNYDCFDAF